MHWITILIIGIAANLDNLGIGVAYGIKKTKITFVANCIISLLSMIMTYTAVTVGSLITHYISLTLANLLGSLLLCAIGIWTIATTHSHKKLEIEDPAYIDLDHNKIISAKESLYLGFILSLNCLVGGIGLGANHLSATLISLSIGFFSILTIYIGGNWGYHLQKTWIGKHAELFSGFLLVAIGIYEIFN